MKRFTPAAVLAAATAFVILMDAVIMVVPGALADPESSATPSARSAAPAVAVASATPHLPTYSLPPNRAYYFVPTPIPTPVPTPVPTAKPTPVPYRDTVWNARIYVKNQVGAGGYDCINAIWTAESGWDPYQAYPAGGDPAQVAYGIPQAHPGVKMARFGSNWRYSPLTQVKWGLWYVRDRPAGRTTSGKLTAGTSRADTTAEHRTNAPRPLRAADALSPPIRRRTIRVFARCLGGAILRS